MRTQRSAVPILLLLLALLAPGLAAQDSNFLFPVDTIVQRMQYGPLNVVDARGSRMPRDRTQRVVLEYPDTSVMIVKWAPAHPGGERFNNQPRYEVGAYRLQQLFLDQDAYVVPPTVMRAVPLSWYHENIARNVERTFSQVDGVVVALQYWLSRVTSDDFWDDDRFEQDSVYARHFANFNILTYLIEHKDANEGNFLVSTDPTNPRVYSVDNGVSFNSRTSDRGTRWRRLRIERLPRTTVDRLRALTEERLHEELGVLAQWIVVNRQFTRTPQAGANLDPGDGVRLKQGVLQFGLTEDEIENVWERIQDLLEDVDDGDLELF